MSDQTKPNPLDLDEVVSIELEPGLGEELAEAVAVTEIESAAMAEQLRTLGELIAVDPSATAIAISTEAVPGSGDYYLDLWAFSTTPSPGGLGLTVEQFWGLTPREWWARYRVWERHIALIRGDDRLTSSQFKRQEMEAAEPRPAIKKGSRGRPIEIPASLKDEALAIKESGGSYKDVAAKLYGAIAPTLQQKKNAATILREHRKKKNRTGQGP